MNFQDFYYRFNGAIYGLEPKETKQLALLQFTYNFKKAFDLAVDFTRTKESAPGIQNIENMPKMELMEAKQNALKSNLAESELLFEFLMGRTSYFDSQLALDYPLLKSIIEFETGFKILTNLNFEYQFEEIRKPTAPIPEEITPIPKEKPMLSDQDAVEYLLANVFNRK